MLFASLGALGASTTLPGTLELMLVTAGGLLPARRPGRASLVLRRLAVIVPAHDEEKNVARTVESLREARHPCPVEILVVADNCTDGTARVARESGATVIERDDPDNRGKGFALELAFERLFYAYPDLDAVMVVDADTSVAPNFFEACASWFSAGADAVQSRYTVRNADESTRTRLMNVALMAFNVLRPRGRSRFGLSAGILGNGFGLSRACLERVPYTARSVVEDLEHHLELVKDGMRVEFMDDTWVKADFPVGERGADTQRARWEGGRFRMVREHAPRLIREILRGRVQLSEPLLELLLLPLAMHVGVLGVTLFVPFLPTQLLAALGLGVVGAHVGVALIVGRAETGDVLALLRAPFYVAWKMKLLPKIFDAARTDQEWVRTAR